MHDTVTKILALADEYANFAYLGDQDSRYNARQALQDELTRLFTPLNQCDGCMAGLPLRSGLHIDLDGKALMLCQKSKYGITGEKNETDE